jgi:hypothetical protein
MPSASDLFNPSLWFAASNLVLANDATVATWSDLSGNARDLTQATETNKPTYKTGITPSGGPVVRFDGVDNFMVATYTLAPTAYEFHGVIIPRSVAGTQTIASGTDGVSSWATALRITGGLYQNYAWDGTLENADSATVPAVGQLVIVGGAAINGGTSKIYINGANEGTNALDAALWTGQTDYRLGVAITTEFAQVDIAEWLFWDNELTDAERVVVKNYLVSKHREFLKQTMHSYTMVDDDLGHMIV